MVSTGAIRRTLWALAGVCVYACASAGCRDEGQPFEAEVSEPGVPPGPDEAAPRAPEPTPEPAPEPAAANIAVRDVGFKTPESVLHDTAADVYLVSNIQGSPVEADDNGFISRLKPDGTLEALKWIDGEKEEVTLHAPKGMGIAGGMLYVSDIKVVRKFDVKTGEPKGEIAIRGATFLNDIAIDAAGTVYVTDTGVKVTPKGFEGTGTDAVYKIVGNKVETLARGKDLGRPNGIFVDASGVWVVTFGTGDLYRVANGKRAELQKPPKGGLDGLVKTKQGLFVISSWDGEQIVQGPPAGPFEIVLAKVKTPADIGYDAKRNRLLVPLFTSDIVQIVGL